MILCSVSADIPANESCLIATAPPVLVSTPLKTCKVHSHSDMLLSRGRQENQMLLLPVQLLQENISKLPLFMTRTATIRTPFQPEGTVPL